MRRWDFDLTLDLQQFTICSLSLNIKSRGITEQLMVNQMHHIFLINATDILQVIAAICSKAISLLNEWQNLPCTARAKASNAVFFVELITVLIVAAASFALAAVVDGQNKQNKTFCCCCCCCDYCGNSSACWRIVVRKMLQYLCSLAQPCMHLVS